MLRGTLSCDWLPESFQGLLIRKKKRYLFAHVTTIWSEVPDASTKSLEIKTLLFRYKEKSQNGNNHYQPFKSRIKSHLLFAGVISSPFSPR